MEDKSDALLIETPGQSNQVPEGVDLSEPIDVGEQPEVPVMPAVIATDADVITVLTRRLIDLPESDPFYDTFIDDLSSQATVKWYKKGDFDMVRLYVEKNLGKVLTRFPDLAQTRVSLAKEKMKKAKAKRRKDRKRSRRR